MATNRIKIYQTFERIWHWSQALLIIFLAVTGFEVHGSITLFGFEKAVSFHRSASYLLLGLIAFAIFWHFTSGEWKQYLPTTRKLFDQIRYYSIGMFRGEKHPVKKTELSKLNPLQRIVYLGFKIVLIPLVVISGILYMYHKTIDKNNIIVISEFSLDSVAAAHTLGAFLLIAFLIIHVYMTTTGQTFLSNIKAMITGYEEIEVEKEKTKEGSA
jgi:thiosulfate reductase cytochrome b subunit